MVYYADSDTVIYAVLGGCCGFLVAFCVVQNNIAWFRNCCRSIGCECVNASIAPEDTLRRKPTSAEQIYAMAELVHAPPKTKINDILEIMVQGPPRTGSVLLPPIQSPYTRQVQIID